MVLWYKFNSLFSKELTKRIIKRLFWDYSRGQIRLNSKFHRNAHDMFSADTVCLRFMFILSND